MAFITRGHNVPAFILKAVLVLICSVTHGASRRRGI